VSIDRDVKDEYVKEQKVNLVNYFQTQTSEGSVTIEEKGELILTFDNSFSKLRKKNCKIFC